MNKQTCLLIMVKQNHFASSTFFMSLPSACTKIYKNTVMTQLKRCQLSLKVPSLYSKQCNIGKNHFIETKQFFPPFLNQVQTRREIQGFFGIMGTKHQTFFFNLCQKNSSHKKIQWGDVQSRTSSLKSLLHKLVEHQTFNQNFPGSFVSRLQVKGNKDSGQEVGPSFTYSKIVDGKTVESSTKIALKGGKSFEKRWLH